MCVCLYVCACACVYLCLLVCVLAFLHTRLLVQSAELEGHEAAFTSAWPASCFGVRRFTTRLLTVFASTRTMLAYTDFSNCSCQVGKCVCVCVCVEGSQSPWLVMFAACGGVALTCAHAVSDGPLTRGVEWQCSPCVAHTSSSVPLARRVPT